MITTLLLSTLFAMPTAVNDTVKTVIEEPLCVILTEANGTTNLQIKGRKGDPNYTFNYTKTDTPSTLTTIGEHADSWDFNLPFGKKHANNGKTRFKPKTSDINILDYIHIGAAVPVGSKGNVPVNAGWNMGFDIVNLQSNFASGQDALSIGFGVDINLLKASDDNRWVKVPHGVDVTTFGEGITDTKSRLTNVNLTLPIRYTHAFTRKLGMDFCVEPQMAIGNRILDKFRENGHKFKERSHGVGNQRFNLGFSLGFNTRKSLGIYVKYTPFNSWGSVSPVNYKMLTVGVHL